MSNVHVKHQNWLVCDSAGLSAYLEGMHSNFFLLTHFERSGFLGSSNNVHLHLLGTAHAQEDHLYYAHCFNCIMASCCGVIIKCWFQCLLICMLAQEAQEVHGEVCSLDFVRCLCDIYQRKFQYMDLWPLACILDYQRTLQCLHGCCSYRGTAFVNVAEFCLKKKAGIFVVNNHAFQWNDQSSKTSELRDTLTQPFNSASTHQYCFLLWQKKPFHQNVFTQLFIKLNQSRRIILYIFTQLICKFSPVKGTW